MWIAFIVVTLALAAYTTARFYGDRLLFTPGRTTAGHHQIETECFTCHTPMAGVKSDACVQCHASELERVDDSHPKSKFTDPRNADLLSKLDARECISCHIEHRPERTLAMGVTQPDDFCAHCHADIAKDRPTHQGLGFDTCADAGCHNFHDNRALHVDYLETRLKLDQQASVGHVAIETRTVKQVGKLMQSVKALHAADADAPVHVKTTPQLIADWAETLHAQMGVGCTGCHAPQQAGASAVWSDTLSVEHCKGCHEREAEGFLASRHGMRIAAKLSPMRVEDAWLPMRRDAGHETLTCNSCHGAHRFDRQYAAVEACVACHDDSHSRAYLDSGHYAAWKAERAGTAAAGTGVSCATCHLPREADMAGAVARVRHNQSDYLRPNEKMLETVCVSCHSAEQALDALADSQLIARGLEGTPAVHVQSMQMVRRKLATLAAERGAGP